MRVLSVLSKTLTEIFGERSNGLAAEIVTCRQAA